MYMFKLYSVHVYMFKLQTFENVHCQIVYTCTCTCTSCTCTCLNRRCVHVQIVDMYTCTCSNCIHVHVQTVDVYMFKP